MHNPEIPAQSAADIIKGDYLEVSILHPDDFRTFLESNSQFTMLYTKAYHDELPAPLSDAQLSWVSDQDGVGIVGEFHFKPDVINANHARSWQDMISGDIREILDNQNYTTYSLPHELYDFYVQLSDQYAAHLRFATDTDDCHVDVILRPTHNPELQSTTAATLSLPDQELDTYALFKDFTTIWADAIDVVVDEYGFYKKKKPQSQIILSVPTYDIPSGDSENHLFDTPTTGIVIPDQEQYTSSEKSFRMLGGLEHPKRKLQLIAETFADPVSARMYGISARHFMLYGPPGTGKTSLIEALAGEIEGATLRHIPTSDIMGSTVGQSGANLAAIFDEAFAQTAPYILFFDEFDGIAGNDNNDSVSHIEVKKILNQCIAKASDNHPNIIIGAATNLDPHQIEDSLIRSGRLEPIAVLKPNESERADIWAAVITRSYVSFMRDATLSVDYDTMTIDELQHFIPYDSDINPLELAALTEDMTGADFEQILHAARSMCYHHYRNTGEKQLVNQAVIIEAINTFGR